MRILIIDDDKEDILETCAGLRQLGHEVRLADIPNSSQETEEFKEMIKQNRPDGIILDLMKPTTEFPAAECGNGYTTGAYFYKEVLHPFVKGTPLVVFSAVELDTSIIQRALQRLEEFDELKGVFEKGKCDEEEIVMKLQGGKRI